MPFLLALAVVAATAVPADPALRLELLEMRRVDQEVRKAMAWSKFAEVDRPNTARMKAIIAAKGWPGIRLVGADGAAAAWLLVQHADLDKAFQQRCLGLMADAVKRHDADGSELAYLVDRVLSGEGKPQRYGTQFDGEGQPQAIEDPARLDERRKEVGLGPFAEYRALIAASIAERKAKEASGGEHVGNPALRKELLAWAAQKPPLAASQAALRRALEQHGWPGQALVGLDGVQAATNLVLAGDLALKEAALPLMKADTHLLPELWAMVEDQVQEAKEGKQRYGTLVSFEGDRCVPKVPIEDPAHLDERRAALGMPPMGEMLRVFEQQRAATKPAKP